MSDTDRAWQQVREDLQALGLKLQLHLKETGKAQEATADEIQDALRQVATAVEGSLSGLGRAFQDQAVREDAARVARSLGEAVASSLTQAGQEVAAAIKDRQTRQSG
jgi:hypothetical protein